MDGQLRKGQAVGIVLTKSLDLEINGGLILKRGIPKSVFVERTRAEGLNPKIVNEYFDLLGTTLDSLGLKNKPRHIYNCDETFLPLDCNRRKQ